jgi:hypothetical protein
MPAPLESTSSGAAALRGGPVYIPKIYNGKNKTFFFFNYTLPAKPGSNPSTVTPPPPGTQWGTSRMVYSDGDPTTGLPFPET